MSEVIIFNMVDIIAKKRDGHILSEGEINWFITNVTFNKIPDYQISALLMAIYLKGMTVEETAWLTNAMTLSGETLSFDNQFCYVDKHSTGGVGDKTSFLIAAFCGCFDLKIPMIAGRGLGHTGGTLDKLESIPGFDINLSIEAFKKQIDDFGVSIIGQTKEIAPADKKLYALRDVTSTVASIPLITASIMSKKLAEGIDGLVLDVKVGSGAFMNSLHDAQLLGRSLVATGNEMGKKVKAIITNMDQPLGKYVGNAHEIIECVEILEGKVGRLSEDLLTLSVEFAAEMLLLGGCFDKKQDAVTAIKNKLESKEALRTFKRLVELQKGDVSYIDDMGKFPAANHKIEVKAKETGYVEEVDALRVGRSAVLIGAGRLTMDRSVDHAAGIAVMKKTGDNIESGDIVFRVFYNECSDINAVISMLDSSLKNIEKSDKKT